MTTPKLPEPPKFISDISEMTREELENIIPICIGINQDLHKVKHLLSGSFTAEDVEMIESVPDKIIAINPMLGREINSLKKRYHEFENLEQFLIYGANLISNIRTLVLVNGKELSNQKLTRHIKNMIVDLTQETLIPISVMLVFKRWQQVS